MNARNPHYRIDPFDLRLFTAVADTGTITAGARAVHLSLAAASARLQALEQAVGAALMQRAKTGITLTDAGRTLLRHAGRLQREMEALHAGMAAHAHGVRSTVRLLCNTAAISEHLPPLLGPFLAAHPDIDVELRELDSQDVLFAMRQERADLGIVADHVATEGLNTTPFREDGLVAVLPAAWSRRLGVRKAGLAFAQLLAQPFVGLPSEAGLSRFLQARALQHGRGLHHRVQVQGFDALLQLVADGVGVAIVPALTARRLGRPGVFVAPLAEPWARRQLLLCFGNSEDITPGAAALLTALRPTTWPR
ncbi:molybdate transport repressor ModE-like protein [Pelomonas saccharophila]|uniref:Molybdate transport repressor ModE-like protein n=1 Tax=Roseateles saccharophilus TaxID=304 RepID=A0ABU1YL19_ROSSA|nr:LysR family transcriptional regulator [Roseateles saccharophilus]MDR7269554.1 molybdate transport repressor ModE-like protein [Roseateles saccharophilus]